MSKDPSYPRYSQDYLADYKVMAMTLEEEGMYNRLMDVCWLQGEISADPVYLAGICKGKQPTELVLSCFIAVGSLPDRNPIALRHKRLDEIRNEREKHRAIQSLAGQKGNKARWGNKRKQKDLIAVGSLPDDSAIAKHRSSLSFSSSSSNKKNIIVADDAIRLSEYLKAAILKRDPSFSNTSTKSINRWAVDIDKLMRIDGRPPQEIERVIDWCQSLGCFWGPNILSGKKLREKFDTLYGAMQNDNLKSQGQKALSVLTGTFGELK